MKNYELLNNDKYRDFILYKLDQGFSHVILDEAQDTSPWQWQVIRSLLEDFFAGNNQNRSFFIVGDEKQSIYSFQGADHRLFEFMRKEFAEKMEFLGSRLEQVDLNISYRSDAKILNLVDSFCNDIEVNQYLMVESKQITHQKFRQDQGIVKLHDFTAIEDSRLVEEDSSWQFPDKIIKKSYKEKEIADKLANFVKDRINAGYHPSDFMILTKARNNIYKSIIESFAEYGISLMSEQKFKLLDHVIIMDLVSIAKFILYPEDDLNFAAILKSPLFNITEDQLFDFASKRGEMSLIDFIKENQPEIYNICEDLTKSYNYLGLFDFYHYLLELNLSCLLLILLF